MLYFFLLFYTLNCCEFKYQNKKTLQCLESNKNVEDSYTSIEKEFIEIVSQIEQKKLIKNINRIYKVGGDNLINYLYKKKNLKDVLINFMKDNNEYYVQKENIELTTIDINLFIETFRYLYYVLQRAQDYFNRKRLLQIIDNFRNNIMHILKETELPDIDNKSLEKFNKCIKFLNGQINEIISFLYVLPDFISCKTFKEYFLTLLFLKRQLESTASDNFKIELNTMIYMVEKNSFDNSSYLTECKNISNTIAKEIECLFKIYEMFSKLLNERIQILCNRYFLSKKTV
ncbi:hypothetical protein AAJ76_1020002732 [Vairimorpha ceranae]|uniref:Uncharacterized protein n=1 Tax=Vairimorpha ceranae TaxID=40302 RepID=A0A0F9Z8I4_9MICR|nr:hypothetical protein AAJ76_1020002732 [Vairimorpha ceranae]KAF5140978.1 hypothetical protein G9O61_00g008220 [Vairimorpha ceranae]KKO74199.1 hypothetical protein AAJ76_1020002732 [Vairimorpha ceranae]